MDLSLEISACQDKLYRSCISARNGTIYYIKEYNMDMLSNSDLIALQKELIAFRLLKHSNLFTQLNVFSTGICLQYYLPFVEYGNIEYLIEKIHRGIVESLAIKILFDILKALIYLHMRNIIHRNVSCKNVYLSSEGKALLGGFELITTQYTHGMLKQKIFDFPEQLNISRTENKILESFIFASSPELLAQDLRGYNGKNDIYSLGLLACQMISGKHPYQGMKNTQILLEKISGKVPYYLEYSPRRSSILSLTVNQMKSKFHNMILSLSQKRYSDPQRNVYESINQSHVNPSPNINPISEMYKLKKQSMIPVIEENYDNEVSNWENKIDSDQRNSIIVVNRKNEAWHKKGPDTNIAGNMNAKITTLGSSNESSFEDCVIHRKVVPFTDDILKRAEGMGPFGLFNTYLPDEKNESSEDRYADIAEIESPSQNQEGLPRKLNAAIAIKPYNVKKEVEGTEKKNERFGLVINTEPTDILPNLASRPSFQKRKLYKTLTTNLKFQEPTIIQSTQSTPAKQKKKYFHVTKISNGDKSTALPLEEYTHKKQEYGEMRQKSNSLFRGSLRRASANIQRKGSAMFNNISSLQKYLRRGHEGLPSHSPLPPPLVQSKFDNYYISQKRRRYQSLIPTTANAAKTTKLSNLPISKVGKKSTRRATLIDFRVNRGKDFTQPRKTTKFSFRPSYGLITVGQPNPTLIKDNTKGALDISGSKDSSNSTTSDVFTFSSEFRAFVLACLTFDPEERPSSADLITHILFRKVHKFKFNREVYNLPSLLDELKQELIIPPASHSETSSDVKSGSKRISTHSLISKASSLWNFEKL